MKALVARQFGPIDAIRMEELADPTPKDGEVLIDVSAAAVNFPDVLVVAGQYQVKPPLPFIPGKELAGVVRAVGAGVAKFRPGDRVIALVEYGAYCERAAVRHELCFPAPPDLPVASAAGLGVAYQTAHFALHHRGQLRRGETVMVTGANGSVGLAAMQLAKAAAATVVALINDPAKREIVLANGADHALLFDQQASKDAFRHQVLEAVGTRGVDLLIDNAGGAAFDYCLRTLAWEGRAVIVGFTSGEIPSIRANYLLVKNISAVGLQWSDYRDRAPDMVARVHGEICRMLCADLLHPRVMATFPFVEFKDAFKLLTSRQTRGKIILMMANA